MLVEGVVRDPLGRLSGVEIGSVAAGSVELVLDKVLDDVEEVAFRLLELKGVDVLDRPTRLTAPAIALLVVDEVLVEAAPVVEEVTIVETDALSVVDDVTTVETDVEPAVETRSVSALLEIRLVDVEDDRRLVPDTDEIEIVAEATDKATESDGEEIPVEEEVRPRIKRRSG